MAKRLWTLPTLPPAQEALIGSSELMGRGASIVSKREGIGIKWIKNVRAMAQASMPLAFKKAIKSLGVTLQVYTLFAQSLFSLFFFPEITAPTLWIKHLVIKDSKLNNSNIRNSGK